MSGHAGGHVIGVGDKVDRPRTQDLLVTLAELHRHAVALPHALCKRGVRAAHLDIGAIPEGVLVLDLRRDDVLGVAGERVSRRSTGDHAAHQILRVDLVGPLDGAGARDELIVQALVAVLYHGVRHVRNELERHERTVDLVKREPVLDQALVLAEEYFGEAVVQRDDFAIGPATELFLDIKGRVVMADGNQRLDAVFLELLENRTVEVETRLIRLLLDALGEDAAPGDGHAEHLESHLGKQRDVLLVMMVEVDGLMIGVVLPIQDRSARLFGNGRELGELGRGAIGHPDGDVAGGIGGADSGHIGARGTAPVDVPSALALIGGRGTAPIEALGKNVTHVSSFSKRGATHVRPAHDERYVPSWNERRVTQTRSRSPSTACRTS